MTCDKCEHLKIMYEPIRTKGVLWDLGRAKCTKYDLITDFTHYGKFKKLTCPKVEREEGEEK